MEIREYGETDIQEMVNIWNEVVGRKFPGCKDRAPCWEKDRDRGSFSECLDGKSCKNTDKWREK